MRNGSKAMGRLTQGLERCRNDRGFKPGPGSAGKPDGAASIRSGDWMMPARQPHREEKLRCQPKLL